MDQTSIVAHSKLLKATADRFRRVFGESATRTESTVPLEAAPAIRHESFRARLESRTQFELLRGNPSDAIERRLRRLGFSTDIIRSATGSGPALEGKFDSRRIGLERIIGRNELLSVRYLDAGRMAGRAVARVVIRSSSGSVLGYGTGSMISPSLFMTNSHVLDSAARAGNAVVEFNFQLGLDGRELPVARFRLRPDLFFTTSPEEELDLTVVTVSEAAEGDSSTQLSTFGFNPLSASEGEILAGESVTVIQHPGGDLKQIALRENRVLRFPNTEDRFLYYETDTTPGSSGAPVFNDQWEVVALHHSGFPERDNLGRLLTTDGLLWREEMGDERIHWIANEGIRVVAIREHLSGLGGLTSTQGTLRDVALNPQPIHPESEPVPGQRPVQVSVPSTVVPATSPVAAAGSTATWTIPLTVSVTLGTPTGGAPSVATPVVTSSPPPATPSLAASRSSEEPEDADFEAARKIFEESRSRPYYDENTDAAERKAYYSGISSTLNPSQLFDALSKLVRNTHIKVLGYKPAIHLYPWVDLQPNHKIRSIYSTQMFEPTEFIARDLEVARLRRERMNRFRRSEAAANPVLEAAFLESLEADLPYNCEHVVPQSWFNKRQPMRGDLHHLFACESKCNSFRSNTPYFDFTNFGEAIRSDCGKSETNKFEPNAGKGTVARATLYFLLRYPGEINSSTSEYTPDRLETLLQWHQDHPVSEYERHRNQAIFAAQGNRNPLVDHPDWAQHLDFEKGLG
ncbi:Endonuclease I [Pirellula staleyi DSM 6068]|uniref:Endonuclease I n=1 Tax=Pirellula staleyi (strain ATCC 27377 / DSM 6068 / ICPB 4128) TaxID=530564 RepID=D2R623_PIRSD|nr:Endonuclease I [Pirellula staleyi DSM 6068]